MRNYIEKDMRYLFRSKKACFLWRLFPMYLCFGKTYLAMWSAPNSKLEKSLKAVWHSLRITIRREGKILKVIKRGEI